MVPRVPGRKAKLGATNNFRLEISTVERVKFLICEAGGLLWVLKIRICPPLPYLPLYRAVFASRKPSSIEQDHRLRKQLGSSVILAAADGLTAKPLSGV